MGRVLVRVDARLSEVLSVASTHKSVSVSLQRKGGDDKFVYVMTVPRSVVRELDLRKGDRMLVLPATVELKDGERMEGLLVIKIGGQVGT